jgi:hypothetical protein
VWGKGNGMTGDRSQGYRRYAAECLTLAQRATDDRVRASLLAMSERWLELARRREQSASGGHVIRAAIGRELNTLWQVSHCLPPHMLALLAELTAAQENNGYDSN